MTSREYWKKREEEALKHYITDEAEYKKHIDGIYDYLLDQIEKEINGFYTKYADAEGITMAEAKKRVSKLDIEAYSRKAEKYVKNKDFSSQANAEMRLYNATMKINRLEMLKANIGLEMVDSFDELQKYFDEILTQRTLDEFERQAGILGESIKNNAKAAHSIVNASFNNATFSDRIWMYQDMLKNELSSLLAEGLIQGRHPNVLAKHLQKRFGMQKNYAERLMRTELCRVQVEAQKKSYENGGYEQYMFIATHSTRTCPVCAALDGKVFDIKSMIPATNAPPMHPNCRCSTAAWEDSKEYEAWVDYLANGGTTKEWEKLKDGWTAQKTSAMRRDPSKFRQQAASEQSHQPLDFESAATMGEAIRSGAKFTKSGAFTVDGLHLNTVNGFNEAMNNVYKRFGRKLDISGLKQVKRSEAAYMQGSYDPMSRVISLKGGMSANALSGFKKHRKKYFNNGWISTDDEYGTFYHEIGHAVWNDLPSSAKDEIRALYSSTKHSAYKQWMDMGGSRSGYSQAEIFGKSLSRYALTDEQEFFSEAFSQIMSGRMRPVSRQINSVLNKQYAKKGG